jgi:hypothetical protein
MKVIYSNHVLDVCFYVPVCLGQPKRKRHLFSTIRILQFVQILSCLDAVMYRSVLQYKQNKNVE